ncbi:MAG TPA: hypothetical protein VFF33_12755 [Ignavibacteriaceae bacterium]|nr:hypothetical protein [Ignavibacteriaceae bacterium]
MKNFLFKIFLLIIFLISDYSEIYAQVTRLKGMGNLFISIEDIDNGLNLYNFSNNPAWMYKDETNAHLYISPNYDSDKGDYKKNYDPYEVRKYDLSFQSINPLGESGTFYGETGYSYENRIKVDRSLRYEPYAGEAFSYNDTTTGSFNYSGPLVKFKYSFELIPSLYIGAVFNYKILDGLKSIYSRAKTLIRETGGSAGMAYSFNENFVIGTSLNYLSNQEKIESQDDNLTDVEVYDFKGDHFSILKRATVIDRKIKKSKITFGPQIYYKFSNEIESIVKFDYSHLNSKFLEPFTQGQSSIREYETGYSTFDYYLFDARTKFYLNEKSNLNLNLSYDNYTSWSRNTPVDLLVWKWEVKNYEIGFGYNYKFKNFGEIGIEYFFSSETADSLKYIDNDYININSNNHFFKLGTEIELVDKILLRTGYNFSLFENDFICGGKNVVTNMLTFGVGIKTFDFFIIDLYASYNERSLKESAHHRANISFNILITLLKF